MSKPNYRRAYPNKKIDRAYRLFVDGKATLRQVPKLTGCGMRTVARYSTEDQWVEERREREYLRDKEAGDSLLLATKRVVMATESEISAAMATPTPDHKAVVLAVLKRHQTFWDRIEARLMSALEAMERRADEAGRSLALGQIVPLLKAAEIACSGVRKAYGIPDVTRMEFEDKTPESQRHAETIRQRRQKRLAEEALKRATKSKEVPN